MDRTARRRTARMAAAIALAGAAAAAPAALAQAPGGATTSGDAVVAVATGQATPKPADARSNSSITAAVARARATATSRALILAQVQAQNIASASGLALGPVTLVSQDTTAGAFFFGPYDQLQGKLGPNRYCGRVEKSFVRRVDGKRRIIRRTVKDCFVPPYVTVTLAVTFSATRAS